jgi:hypothetical protein
MDKQYECPACSGKGMFVPAIPSCHIQALKPPWIVVEKCDTCDKFKDDLSAALTEFSIAGWFLCTDGGYHALVDTRSKTHC